MCSTTIIAFTSTFIAADIFKNYFFMVKSICVQSPLLARLATVSVWQRAENCQPRSRARTRRAVSWPHLSLPHTYVEPAVNRQPSFRQELVEQSATCIISF